MRPVGSKLSHRLKVNIIGSKPIVRKVIDSVESSLRLECDGMHSDFENI